MVEHVKTTIQKTWQSLEVEQSAQTAALLILTAIEGGWPISPQWVTTMLKQQRYDGSWQAEPLYITCSRGNQVDWYRSRLVTTAICYRALSESQQTSLMNN